MSFLIQVCNGFALVSGLFSIVGNAVTVSHWILWVVVRNEKSYTLVFVKSQGKNMSR